MNQSASAIPNANQYEEWNNATGRRWLERHVAVDRQIAPFGLRAMEAADVRPGEWVLDVGCGCGETSFALARRVGPSGFVTGIDISRVLLEAARQAADRSKVSNLRFEAADAQTFPLPAQSFDVVFSRFGIMFFDDPDAAFSNLWKALRPGGRLSFVCWPAPRENQFMTIPIAAASRHIELPQPSDPEAPGPFAFADKERIKRILSRAGFCEIETDRVIEKVGGATLDESARMLLELGPLTSILDELEDKTRRAIFEDIRGALEDIKSAGPPILDAAAWLVTARTA
jgi:ubiquinone/menaquinone biosynthesis C-methylase UbiE